MTKIDGETANEAAANQAEKIAELLRSCLDASTGNLDLNSLESKEISTLAKSMDKFCWEKLNNLARSLQSESGRTPHGISWVRLHLDTIDKNQRKLLEGMSGLEHLTCLELTEPESRFLNLRMLTPPAGQELLIRLHINESGLEYSDEEPGVAPAKDTKSDVTSDVASDVESDELSKSDERENHIHVSVGTRVEAIQPEAQVQFVKRIVKTYLGQDEHPIMTRRLAGVLVHPHLETGMQVDWDMNGKSNFVGDDKKNTSPILCRHLATAFALERREYLQSKRATGTSQTPKKHFSFAPFESEQAIVRSVSPKTDEIYKDILNMDRSAPMVAVSSVHEVLADHFRAMVPGDIRQFMVTTSTHAMYLELQVKGAADGSVRAYTVRFYDPRNTVTAPRIDFDDIQHLTSKALARLTAKLQAPDYHVEIVPWLRLTPLFDAIVDIEAPTRLTYGLDPESLPSPEVFICTAIRSNDLQWFREIFWKALGTTHWSMEKAQAITTNAIRPGWHPSSKAYLLYLYLVLYDRRVANLNPYLPLWFAKNPAKPEFAKKFESSPSISAVMARLLVDFERVTIPKRAKLDVLNRHFPHCLNTDAMLVNGVYVKRPELLESTYAMAHEIVLSKKLDIHQKKALIQGLSNQAPAGATPSPGTAAGQPKTLAAHALDAGDVDMPLALACAILHAGRDEIQTEELLKGLGVSIENLLLESLKGLGLRMAKGWLARVMTALPSSNWPRKNWESVEKFAIKNELSIAAYKSPTVQSETKSARNSAAPELPPRPVIPLGKPVRIAGLMEGSAWTWQTIALTPIAVDMNPGLMICSVDTLPYNFAMYLIDKGSRPASSRLDVPAGKSLLLIPIEDLRPLADTDKDSAQKPQSAPQASLPATPPMGSKPENSPPAAVTERTIALSIEALKKAEWLWVKGDGMPSKSQCKAARFRFQLSHQALGAGGTFITCRADVPLDDLAPFIDQDGPEDTKQEGPFFYRIPIDRLATGTTT